MLKHLYRMLQNQSNVVASIEKMALSCATFTGRNISYLCHNFYVNFTDSLLQCVNRVYCTRTHLFPVYEAVINLVQSLLSFMQGTSYIDCSVAEILDLFLTNLCIY